MQPRSNQKEGKMERDKEVIHLDHRDDGIDFDPACEICIYKSLRSSTFTDTLFIRNKPRINNRGIIALKKNCIERK